MNSKSCRQIATDIYDLIVDNRIDVLMLTETWLYSNGDEAYIAATSSVRSLVQDLEEVASAQLFKILFKNFIVCVSGFDLHVVCVCGVCVYVYVL